jgi:hypothetical protein
MSLDKRGWIGVDLDGTLAVDTGEKWSPYKIGDPVWPMVDRIVHWLEDGYRVKIMTARACDLDWNTLHSSVEEQKALIQDWLVRECGLPRLEVTCQKDYMMTELWDDRAVQVEKNTGEPTTYWQSRA